MCIYIYSYGRQNGEQLYIQPGASIYFRLKLKHEKLSRTCLKGRGKILRRNRGQSHSRRRNSNEIDIHAFLIVSPTATQSTRNYSSV